MAPQEQLVAGRYRLLRTLATGRMGRVWLAADEVLHRQVAIRKCVPPAGLGADEQEVVRELTMREARAFAGIGNPNVVSVLDVLPDEDEPWIVMEYVASRSLLQVIEETGPLPPARVAAIGLAVLHGLTATSGTGVLHLDVEPANVLIGDGGRIVLSDFGPPATEDGARPPGHTGSPRYVAPERLLGGDRTPQADLWSLGATLYHAVEGHPPYAGRPPRRAGPLTGVLEGLLQHDPAARLLPSDVEERLRRVAGPPAPPPPPSAAAERPRLRRVRWATAAATAAVIAAVGAAASTTGKGDPTGTPTTATASPTVRRVVVLPGDFTWWNDPTGFRVAVPRGWRHSRDPTGELTFTAPQGGLTLSIGRSTAPPGNSVAALTAEEGKARPASYRRIRIENGVWEYTVEDRSGRQMRVLRRLLTVKSHGYAVEWRTPTAAWTAQLPKLTVVVDSFGPVPGR
ncbi:serine/threonine-protein kinase [Actinoplanes sp. NPDC049681]|uniref:serine/threonine-protein kinase n=1 Tax=Actinoplanes sp. NPDC049681 TaxID=3363905 RepID=UPI00378FD765